MEVTWEGKQQILDLDFTDAYFVLPTMLLGNNLGSFQEGEESQGEIADFWRELKDSSGINYRMAWVRRDIKDHLDPPVI